jgi:hypothetical protein
LLFSLNAEEHVFLASQNRETSLAILLGLADDEHSPLSEALLNDKRRNTMVDRARSGQCDLINSESLRDLVRDYAFYVHGEGAGFIECAREARGLELKPRLDGESHGA